VTKELIMMTIRKSISKIPVTWCRTGTLIRYLVVFFSFYILVPAVRLSGQEEFDEILVFLEVPGVGVGEIEAVIKGNELYLPVTDLFDFLKIKNSPSDELQSITGFFISPDAKYSINRTTNEINYKDKTYNLLPGDLIRTESNLYLKSEYLGRVFGLDCNFSFRSMSVTVKSKIELPLIREMRMEEMRKNLTRLNGEDTADTTFGRTYPAFRFGMADWSVSANEELKGKSDVTLNLALGAMIAGGEANASLYYNSNQPFTEKQQHYLWRYVNNDFSPLRQVMAGKISTNAISSIYNPVIGVQLTNTPTTYRRSFGSYTLSDKTEPGWIVELYVNNVMVDYIKADASGFFTFQVPLVYGNSIVKLKFYGPWGEERVREQNINIPFNFLPVNTMEYTVSAGIVEDSIGSRFSRASVNYGVTRGLTVGGGVEYLSSVIAQPAMPYLNASFRITNNLLLSGEFAPRVRTKGTLSFTLPSNLQLDLNYTLYDTEQKAINFNYLEERKAVLSMPLKLGKYSSYQRFTVYQIVLPTSDYTTGEWLFSGSVAGVSTNLTTYGLFVQENDPYFYINLSLGIRLPANFVLMPQAQYAYTTNEFISAKIAVEKNLTHKAFLNLSFEQVFQTNLRLAELGFRYDFSFAQTGASVRQSGDRTSFVQYARGSFINDSKSKFQGVDNRTNVGKGGIAIIPYLDLNANGRKDDGEPKAYGLNIRTNGGYVKKSDSDSTVRILGLEPYTNCFIELDANSFENISWRLPFRTMNVAVDPNIIKNIELAITVVGEATGKVLFDRDGDVKGIGRIIVSFFKNNLKPVGRTLTEDDGYFSYFGLAPGNYTLRIDTAQLKKLGMTSAPESIDFEIHSGMDGDIADGLDFTLKMKPSDTTAISLQDHETVIRKDTTYLVVHEVTQELVTITEDSYAIQMGAFRRKANAESLRRKIEKILNKKVEIVVEDNYYKVRVSEIKTREEVDKDIVILHKNGVNELWVISLKAKHQQYVLREIQDTVVNIRETIDSNLVFISPEMMKHLGAFNLQSNALKLRDPSDVSIIDQTVLDLMKDESTGKLGVKDMWMVPFIPKPVEEPVEEPAIIIIRETPPAVVERKFEVPAIVKPVTTPTIKEEKIIVPEATQVPKFSLQVGVYYKQSDALRAQRKIVSKLKLPVEIVKRYEYYHVIVKGFFTREETYKYYPELAGLGFPGVTLIEEP